MPLNPDGPEKPETAIRLYIPRCSDSYFFISPFFNFPLRFQSKACFLIKVCLFEEGYLFFESHEICSFDYNRKRFLQKIAFTVDLSRHCNTSFSETRALISFIKVRTDAILLVDGT